MVVSQVVWCAAHTVQWTMDSVLMRSSPAPESMVYKIIPFAFFFVKEVGD